MDYSKIITIDPGKRGGKPFTRGMRITVSDVIGYLAGVVRGDSRRLSPVTEEDIRACLASAADRRQA